MTHWAGEMISLSLFRVSIKCIFRGETRSVPLEGLVEFLYLSVRQNSTNDLHHQLVGQIVLLQIPLRQKDEHFSQNINSSRQSHQHVTPQILHSDIRVQRRNNQALQNHRQAFNLARSEYPWNLWEQAGGIEWLADAVVILSICLLSGGVWRRRGGVVVGEFAVVWEGTDELRKKMYSSGLVADDEIV